MTFLYVSCSVLDPLPFLLHIICFHRCSSVLDFHFFAHDPNVFHSDGSILMLESRMNNELGIFFNWLCSNKLSLNTNKTNFFIFHPLQNNIVYHEPLH